MKVYVQFQIVLFYRNQLEVDFFNLHLLYFLFKLYMQISKAWELPVMFLLKLTIPQTTPSEWSRFYASANIVLCPLALLYACNSFMPFDHPIVFLLPQTHFPLWFILLFASSLLAVLHFITEKEPPKTE